MRQITGDMVKTIMAGGGLVVDGYIIELDYSYNIENVAVSDKDYKLHAVSEDGITTLTTRIGKFSNLTLKQAIQGIVQDINSKTHLSESAFKNGIRLDTEHRCQNSRCNPLGKRRLLFVSAGSMEQPMQIKCKCGWMNTFWNNRIDFDEFGALYMKKRNIPGRPRSGSSKTSEA